MTYLLDVSTLIALPVFDHDILPYEREAWSKLREQHFAELRAANPGSARGVRSGQKIKIPAK